MMYGIIGGIAAMYALIGGLLLPVPNLPILEQSIRNLYYHVPMWFGMTLLLLGSMVQAVRFLKTGDIAHDIRSATFAQVGLVFGVVGLVTGMIWAKNTWGTYWTNDPKLNSAAIGVLMYFAYTVLRGSIEDEEKKARVSAIFNIFNYPVFVVILFVLPRLTDSLHPGNGGNPGFSAYDLDSRLRMVFYPAVIGWSLMGFWMANLCIRVKQIENKALNA